MSRKSAAIEMEELNAFGSIQLFIIEPCKVHSLVIMIVNFCIMARMVVIVRAVVLGVFVVVYMSITAVRVLMDVLVEMVMYVRMGMLVGVFHVTVGMLMCVRVGMLMPVYMFMFVFPFHNYTSFHWGQYCRWKITKSVILDRHYHFKDQVEKLYAFYLTSYLEI